jgi:hypothetical protein
MVGDSCFPEYVYLIQNAAIVCARYAKNTYSHYWLRVLPSPAGVMLMRAYAFTGRNIRVLVLLLVFYAALIGIDVWFFCFNVVTLPDLAYELLGGTGCFPDYAANNGSERLAVSTPNFDSAQKLTAVRFPW